MAAADSAGAPEAADGYRIDDLARLAGTTVRNVRAYQDRRLLPPPRRAGRVGWYSEAHLARLRLIGEMLGRGYSLANIAELIDSWVQGQGLSDLLGLDAVLVAREGEDRSSTLTREELRDLFAPLGLHLDAATDLGLIRASGDRFRVAAPRLIESATVLADAGVPAEEVFELVAAIAAATEDIGRRGVEMITTHVVGAPDVPMSPEQLRRLTAVLRRLRPLVAEAVGDSLAAALDRHLGAKAGEPVAWAGGAGEPAAP